MLSYSSYSLFQLFFFIPSSIFAADTNEEEEHVPEAAPISISDMDTSGVTISIPSQQRCAAHTMNLVVKDANNIQIGSEHGRLHVSTMEKCQCLWNKQSRSVLVSGRLL